MVGEEGHGVRTIMEMVNHTRLDCTIGTSAIMRQSLAQAMHHTRHRSAFGQLLKDQPLMRNVLADLALESEAATALAMHIAHLYDVVTEDESRRPFVRLATAVAKYWVCKRAPNMVFEALECHGGDGYMDPGPMPRWYREAPVSSVWEGSGNVICLDTLKTMSREPESVPMFLEELARAKGTNKRYDAFLVRLEDELAHLEDIETRARRIVERLALAFQASLLLRHSPSFVGDAFCGARLEGDAGLAYGTLPANTPFVRIIERATPQVD
jgi:putative acyl-CoA dehydrogenase